jgi:hypothetical protein
MAEMVGMFGESLAAESSPQRGNFQSAAIVYSVLCQCVLRIKKLLENERISVEIYRY